MTHFSQCKPRTFFWCTIGIALLVADHVCFATVESSFKSSILTDNFGTMLWNEWVSVRGSHTAFALAGDIDYTGLRSSVSVNGLRTPPRQTNLSAGVSMEWALNSVHTLKTKFTLHNDWAEKNYGAALYGSGTWSVKRQESVFLDKMDLSVWYRWGYLDDGKPRTRALHIPSRGSGVSAVFGWSSVECGLSYSAKWIDPLTAQHYAPGLVDTQFYATYATIIEPRIDAIPVAIDTIQANHQYKIDFYMYGALTPFFYCGAYYTYETSRNNLWMLTGEKSETTENESPYFFDYFPYKTPVNRYYGGVQLVLIKTLRGIFHSAKVSAQIPVDIPILPVPFKSQAQYRGFYVPPDNNLLQGFESFTYSYSALAPVSVTASLHVSPINRFVPWISYTWTSEPYKRNAFFSSDMAYHYHSLSVSFTIR